MAGLGLDPNLPAVALHDFFADRQPNAGAGILLACVQSLENLENAVKVLWLHSDAIVTH